MWGEKGRRHLGRGSDMGEAQRPECLGCAWRWGMRGPFATTEVMRRQVRQGRAEGQEDQVESRWQAMLHLALVPEDSRELR